MCIFCQKFTGTPDAGDTFFYAAYIDPGTGFVFTSFVPMVLGIAATFIGSVIFFLRKKIWPLIKRFKYFIFILLILGAIGIILGVVRQNNMKTTTHKKVVILGVDGLDPKLVEEGFQKGLLPNLQKIASEGTYEKLETVMPPQSPVAWASFMTGSEPAKHKVFDFIKRDRETYLPDLVFSDPKRSPIQAQPFWEITTARHIPTTVLFLPDTFPSPQFDGKLMSGMGTPDVLGTEGSLTLFSSTEFPLDPKWRGRLVRIGHDVDIQTAIDGPKYTVLKEKKKTSIPFAIHKDSSNKKVTITIQNQKIVLAEHEFSPWIRLEFSIDFFTKIKAIARFYIKQIDPDMEIYLSPMNFDPINPVYPISSPKGYAKELANKYGLFSTLGLPHDVWALEENIFDERSFLSNADDIFNQRNAIILGELATFKSGLFFGYIGITDTIQHMFWRNLEEKESPYQDTILSYYQKVDGVVGEVLKTLKPNDTLIIMSDHGFDRYDYEFNVNTWLMENNFLKLKDNRKVGRELLEDVDWTKTKAYSMGYNGIYLNLKNREGQGLVTKEEAGDVAKDIIDKLTAVTNPATGKPVLKNIYTRKDLGISPTEDQAADIFLGYFKGTRSSWDTAVGAVPEALFVQRQSKWSGDHLFDPSEIPGVLFMNGKIKTKNPRIIDVIPTALSLFDIPVTGMFDGISLIRK